MGDVWGCGVIQMYKRWFHFTKIMPLIIPIILVILLASINFLASFGMQLLIDGALNNNVKMLLIGAIILFLTAVVYGLAYYNLEKNNANLESSIFIKIKEKCIRSFLFKPLLEIESIEQTEMYIKLEEDSMRYAKTFTKGILPIINLVMTLLIGSIYILMFSWQIFIICIISVMIIVLINNTVAKELASHIHSLQEIQEVEVKWYNDIFHSKNIINIFNAKVFLQNKLDKILIKKKSHVKSKERINSINFIINDSGILAIESLIFFVGILSVIKGSISLGTLLGIHNAAIGTFIWPITDLPEIVNSINEQNVSYKRLKPLLEDSSYNKVKNYEEENNKLNKSPGLSLQSVSFSYLIKQVNSKISKKEILNQINISFPPFGITLIIGESGAGKSTLLKILLGLYPISNGKILKDGIEINSDELIKVISYAPQGYSILPISIKDNLLLGSDKSQSRLEEFCNIVGLHKWIMSLPEGYNTIIDKKDSMSSGQGARLAIVRSLVKDCEYIILDEPFAQLDENTINEISILLRKISISKSIIIVSHRNPPEFLSDRIFNLKGGKVYVS